MNLDELRTVQHTERSKDSLQHLRESFYADVGEYVADLKRQRDRAAERADDPFDSPEVDRLNDEIKTAEEVLEAIYERRVGKVLKRAGLAAAGMADDDEGLTGEERALFEELVERIDANKQTVLDVLDGESGGPASAGTGNGNERAPTPDGGAGAAADGSRPDRVTSGDAAGDDSSPPTSADATPGTGGAAGTGSGPSAEDSSGAGSSAGGTAGSAAPAANGADPAGEPPADPDERTTVRVTADVGEILGVDERTYDLEREDVVTLPEANAGPLVERGAAEELE